MAAREVMDLHMCYGKPRTGHILDWKTNEPQNMPRNIYDSFCFVLFFQFSYAENLGVQNMPKSYEQTGPVRAKKEWQAKGLM